jgi:hypothetical protein
MKSAILLAVAVVVVSSLPIVLRHTEAAAQEGMTAPVAATQGNRSPEVIAQILPKSSRVSDSAPRNFEKRPTSREPADKVDTSSLKTEPAKARGAEELKTMDKGSAVTLPAK